MQTKTLANRKGHSRLNWGGALLILLAALSLCFFAACSDDTSGVDTIPTEAIGEYNATEYLATQIASAISGSASMNSITVQEDDSQNNDDDTGISLTINSDNTVSVSVDLSKIYSSMTAIVTIPGTCVYSSSGSSFTFTLNYNSATATDSSGSSITDDDLSTLRTMMNMLGPSILAQFNPAYYSNGALYDSNGTTDSYKIFTKATDDSE